MERVGIIISCCVIWSWQNSIDWGATHESCKFAGVFLRGAHIFEISNTNDMVCAVWFVFTLRNRFVFESVEYSHECWIFTRMLRDVGNSSCMIKTTTWVKDSHTIFTVWDSLLSHYSHLFPDRDGQGIGLHLHSGSTCSNAHASDEASYTRAMSC